jgi:hypothetical protein
MKGWGSLRGIAEIGVVPAEWVEKCFRGEADRILALLIPAYQVPGEQYVRRSKRKVDGAKPPRQVEDYRLPEFKSIDELSGDAYQRAAAQGGESSRRGTWNVVGIYDKNFIANRLDGFIGALTKDDASNATPGPMLFRSWN